MPTYKSDYRFKTADYLSRHVVNGHEMHALPQTSVFRIADEERCFALEVFEDAWIGNREREVSNTFLFQKDQSGKARKVH